MDVEVHPRKRHQDGQHQRQQCQLRLPRKEEGSHHCKRSRRVAGREGIICRPRDQQGNGGVHIAGPHPSKQRLERDIAKQCIEDQCKPHRQTAPPRFRAGKQRGTEGDPDAARIAEFGDETQDLVQHR